MKHDEVTASEGSGTVVPTIALELCTGCGLCVEGCPTGAVELGRSGMPRIVRPEACAYCGACEELCPEGAVALEYEVAAAR